MGHENGCITLLVQLATTTAKLHLLHKGPQEWKPGKAGA
jgi:hypothetical protein